MTTRYDIAIIGGGVIGLSLARRLALEGASLVVVDPASAPKATTAAAGMLAPSFESIHGGALYDFSAESMRRWPSFAQSVESESGDEIDYRDDGILGVALRDDDAAALSVQHDQLKTRGADVAMLSGADARALEPALSEKVVAAMAAPTNAQVDPKPLQGALRRSVSLHGGDLIDALATALERDGAAWRLSTAFSEPLRADAVVIASGAGPRWPFDHIARPPIFPVKGEAFAIETGDGAPVRRVVRGPGAYICPKAGGRIVIGATEAPNCDDLIVSPAAVADLRRAAVAVAPALADYGHDEGWAGLRPATPDGAPILGSVPGAPGAWFALGHYRNGVLLAPASADALAAAILGRQGEIDLSPFGADRFG